jgi:hypothetical protein
MSGIVDFLRPDQEAEGFVRWMIALTTCGGLAILYDIHRLGQALSRGERAYAQNVHHCASDPPEQHLRATAEPERGLKFIAPLPAILVTLGILGTFVGIGRAVAEAIPALQTNAEPQQVREALRALLEAVKFKFQTSAWGILCSLAFVLVTTFYEFWVHRTFGAAVERIALHRTTTAAELGVVLGSSLQGMAAQVELLKEILTPFSAKVLTASNAMTTSANKLGSLGGDIDRSLQQMARNLEAAGQHQQRTMSEELAKLTAMLQSSTQRQSAALDQSLQQMTATLQRSLEQQRGGLEAQQGRIADMMQRQAQAAASLQSALGASLQRMDDSIGALTTTQRDGLANLQGYMATVTTALERVDGTLQEARRTSERLMELVNKIRAENAQRPPPPILRAGPVAGPAGGGTGAGEGEGFL